MRFGIVLVLLGLVANPAWAARVEGVFLAEQIELAGKPLQLNGAGVRTKFFFDIYVGALYLPRLTTDAREAIEGPGPKRVSMHFLYSEVEREKLVDGWTEGFEKNQSRETMAKLRKRLRRFNALFRDAHEGDTFLFDFLPDGTTEITLADGTKDRIEGEDFQRALLAVWLGKDPADKRLKEKMLRGGH